MRTSTAIGIAAFFLYLLLNVLASQFYVTARYIPHYIDTINWPILILSIFLSLIIAALVAANAANLFRLYSQRKELSKAGMAAGAGAAAGLAAGVCTACVGIIPLIFGLAGLSVSLAALPLKGAEVQLIVAAVLACTLILLNRNLSKQQA